VKVRKARQARAPADNKLLRYSVYFIVFGATVAGGAFFAPWLVILNILFLLFLLLRRKALAIDLNSVFLAGLVISTIAVKSNAGIAIEELIKYSLFPLSYVVFLNIEDKKMVESAFYRSFILLAVAGLMAMAGLPLVHGMVIEESRRLQSFVQYANTTAMLLSAGVLMSIHYYVKTKNKSDVLYGVIMLAALILTRSRIGIAVFIAVTAFYGFVLIRSKIKYYILAALIVFFLGVFAIGHRFVIPLILGPTLIERLLTMIDAFNELRSNIFGIGMGAWQYLHFQFQSAPYQVRYIHSVYFQIALDSGILGLLCFLAAVVN
jgi:O-antigen ligase